MRRVNQFSQPGEQKARADDFGNGLTYSGGEAMPCVFLCFPFKTKFFNV